MASCSTVTSRLPGSTARTTPRKANRRADADGDGAGFDAASPGEAAAPPLPCLEQPATAASRTAERRSAARDFTTPLIPAPEHPYFRVQARLRRLEGERGPEALPVRPRIRGR